jgi:hypothetical protein
MYTNSPALNPLFGTSMAQRVSQQKPPGSRLFTKDLSWPLINAKNVAKYFPESEVTQKGHMRGQHQGVRSTRMTEPTEDIPTNIPHQKRVTFSSRNTSQIPHVCRSNWTFSGGIEPRQQLRHDLAPSSWVEAM